MRRWCELNRTMGIIAQVNLATANPAHPATKFAVGTKRRYLTTEVSKLQTELEQLAVNSIILRICLGGALFQLID